MFETVSQGQPVRFSARQYNSWNRTSEIVQNGDPTNSGDPPRKLPSNPMLIWIRNKSEQAVDIFGVLAVGDPVFRIDDNIDTARADSLNQKITFEGKTPGGTDDETICIVLHPVNKEEITAAMIIGPTCCIVDIQDTAHRFAEPIQGDATKLRSSETGSIRLVVPPNETGEKFVHVILGFFSPSHSSVIYGIVVEAIRRTEDPAGGAENYTYGKVKVLGDEENLYDCACLDLCRDPNGSNHEQLYKGLRVELSGPYQRPGPEGEGAITYYEVSKREKEYRAVLNSDMESGDYGTFTVKDSDGNDVVMAVSGASIPANHMIFGNQAAYSIRPFNWILMVVGGPCARPIGSET